MTQRSRFGLKPTMLALVSITTFTGSSAHAKEPGRGLTAQFEIDYLQFIIDHHFAALRMTELAAGTEQQNPSAEIREDERVPPTPGFSPTPAKARLEALKSLARRNNRMQREELLMAQQMLRDWYGIRYQPRIRRDARRNRQARSDPGWPKLRHRVHGVFSRHHLAAAQLSLECMVGSELRHFDLKRFCHQIVEAQVASIDEMRHRLCDTYNICDYQPSGGIDGQHI